MSEKKNVRFECPNCGQRGSVLNAIEIVAAHIAGPNVEFECSKCGEVFSFDVEDPWGMYMDLLEWRRKMEETEEG